MIQGIYRTSIDINLIVSQLLARASQPLEILQEREEKFQDQLTALQLIQTRLASLKNTLFPLKAQGSSSIFNEKEAISSNESVLTAIASSSALAGVYNITVNQLATQHKVASDQWSTSGYEIYLIEGQGTKTFRITINGVDTDISVDINAGDDNLTILQNIAQAINSSGVEAKAIVVNETGTSARLIITSNEPGTQNAMTMQDLTGTLLSTSGVLDGTTVYFYEDYENSITLNSYVAPRWTAPQDNDPSSWELTNTDYYTGTQSLRLYGNTWKIQSTSPFSLNANTKVKVAVNVPDEGEIQGIGFYDTTSGNQYVYQLTGTQNWMPPADGSQYQSPPWAGWQVFTFNLGQDWFNVYGVYNNIDEVQYINDNDAGSGDVRFDSLIIYSQTTSTSFKNELQAAQDADFTIDGLNFTRSSNVVDDAIEGVTLNLISSGNATLTITQDTDAIISAIEAFVQDYNDAISAIKAQTAYDVDTNTYYPLTNDTLIKNITSELRHLATDLVSGQPEEVNSLFTIGIEVDKYGVMSITDRARLESVIKNNPDDLARLFNETGVGIASRMDNYLDNILGPQGKVTKRIDTVNDRISDIQEDIEEFQAYLDGLEEKLLLEWSKVEQIISQNDTLSLFMAQRLLPTYQQQQGYY